MSHSASLVSKHTCIALGLRHHAYIGPIKGGSLAFCRHCVLFMTHDSVLFDP